jgi:hypothetical protein
MLNHLPDLRGPAYVLPDLRGPAYDGAAGDRAAYTLGAAMKHRHLLLTAVLAFGLLSLPAAAAQETSAKSAGIARLERWLKAVEEHVPGKADYAALSVRDWVGTDVDLVRPYLEGLLALMPPPDGAPKIKLPGSLSREEIDELLNLGARNPAIRGRVALLKRAAVLHADVGILRLAEARRVNSESTARSVAGTSASVVLLGKDGEIRGYAVSPPHWQFGRWLLDYVDPTPESLAFVRLWYRATMAFLLFDGNWSDAEKQVRYGLERMPNEAGFHYDLGCVLEAYASPRLQIVTQAAHPRAGDVERNLKDAEEHFRRAADMDKQSLEPRIRLARVRALLGRTEVAAADLRAIPPTGNTIVAYYAAMFLGDVEQQLGRRQEAADAFARAAALYPKAQGPLLALSLLSANAGNRADALAALNRLLAIPADEKSRLDPWWDYRLCIGRNADAIVGLLWSAAVAAGQ